MSFTIAYLFAFVAGQVGFKKNRVDNFTPVNDSNYDLPMSFVGTSNTVEHWMTIVTWHDTNRDDNCVVYLTENVSDTLLALLNEFVEPRGFARYSKRLIETVVVGPN